jgi:hypothetical protein
MKFSCHSERSEAKRNEVEESLTVSSAKPQQLTVRDASTSLGMTEVDITPAA